MQEKSTPGHQVELNRLLCLDLSHSEEDSKKDLFTRIHRLNFLTEIHANYSLKERKEISQIAGLHPDVADYVTQSRTIDEFAESVKIAFSLILRCQISYHRMAQKNGDFTEIRIFEWIQSKTQLQTTMLLNVSKGGEITTTVNTSLHDMDSEHALSNILGLDYRGFSYGVSQS